MDRAGSIDPGAAATAATALQLIYVFGALVNASTHARTFLPGAWINIGLAAAYWAGHGIPGITLAAGLGGVTLLATRFAAQIERNFTESIRMRFENVELVRQLEREKGVAVEANQAKSRFLAAASHDLRQPLHALLMFSALVENAGDAQRSMIVGHIRDAAQTLDKLFAGLLDLSKLEAGAVQANLQAVWVDPLTQSLSSEFGAKCGNKGLEWHCTGVGIGVLADAFLLERVLRNLLDNALKYTRTGHVELHCTRCLDTQVEIAVVDTGIGIAAAQREAIFEEFFQIDNEARDSERGSGLGLAIVRRLCDLMGIELSVQSSVGSGSRFSLLLPWRPPPASQPLAQGMPDTTALAGLRVWVVEDNKHARVGTGELLGAVRCNCSSRSSGWRRHRRPRRTPCFPTTGSARARTATTRLPKRVAGTARSARRS